MALTQGQISEIISNYTSSSEGFVTVQSLIMNSLMAHERELFVKANKNEQCNGFRPRRWYCTGNSWNIFDLLTKLQIGKSAHLVRNDIQHNR